MLPIKRLSLLGEILSSVSKLLSSLTFNACRENDEIAMFAPLFESINDIDLAILLYGRSIMKKSPQIIGTTLEGNAEVFSNDCRY